jgi:quinol monooxygenase YgiN
MIFMGRVVIVAYQPKPGKAEELKALTRTHVPRLQQEGLVTDRHPVLLETGDGTIIEIFEWLSAEAIQQAHQNKGVHQMWAEFDAVCTYIPLNTLSEAANMFAEFTPID